MSYKRSSNYDNPRYGPKREAAGFEDACQQVYERRPDAQLEGSAGFAWTFFQKGSNYSRIVGTMWFSPRSNKHYYRLLSEGFVDW